MVYSPEQMDSGYMPDLFGTRRFRKEGSRVANLHFDGIDSNDSGTDPGDRESRIQRFLDALPEEKRIQVQQRMTERQAERQFRQASGSRQNPNVANLYDDEGNFNFQNALDSLSQFSPKLNQDDDSAMYNQTFDALEEYERRFGEKTRQKTKDNLRYSFDLTQENAGNREKFQSSETQKERDDWYRRMQYMNNLATSSFNRF